jgi:hypothetical protein
MIENFQKPGSEDLMPESIESSLTFKGFLPFLGSIMREDQIPEVISKRVPINTYTILNW